MTYANAVLPHALFIAAQRWPKESFLEVAKTSFAFLDRTTTADDVFWPVGNNGWYPHGEEKALYDQQPVEAATMAEAALAAFDVLGDDRYLATFHRAHAWFHGQNSLAQSLVDVHRGACCDGLQPTGVNRNQGAESTLAYLWTESLTVELQAALSDRRASPSLPARRLARITKNPQPRNNDAARIETAQSARGTVPSPSGQPDPHGRGLALSGPYGVQRRRVPGRR